MKLGLTYSDVLLVPQRTPLNSRSEADTKSRFTKNILLNIPLVSANMATVTENKMAIAIGEAVRIMKTDGVTSLLIMEDNELVGIFTSRDYLFEEDMNRSIREVMTTKEKLVTAEYGISLEEAKKILHQHRIEKLPLLHNGKVLGLLTTQDIKK